MLSKVIEACAHNRFLVFTAVLLLTLAGIWSLRHVPLDALPGLRMQRRHASPVAIRICTLEFPISPAFRKMRL